MTIRSVKSGTLNTLQVAGTSSVAVPTPPAKPTITNVGANGFDVNYTPSLIGGTATSWTAVASPGGSSTTGATSPLVIAGLSDSTEYTVTVKATNANGDSVFSVASDPVTTLTPYNLSVDYLVIAGGGSSSGSGYSGGGGGGAGGYRTSAGTSGAASAAETPITITSGVAYTVTVGASTGNSVFSTVSSFRGGTASGGNGGSGAGEGGLGTALQGRNGGGSRGGGGGANTAGGTGGPARYDSYSGNGGDGIASSITGSSVTRAAGAPGYTGGAHNPYAGRGGGGNGSYGAGGAVVNSGAGNYSGIVVLRYDSAKVLSVGAGLTGTTNTVGGNKVTTFTAGTGTVVWS